MSHKTIKFVTEDDDGNETEHMLPAMWVICDRCNGDGKHDHPAFSNGITASEWDEWHPDEQDDYMRGAYDVTCEECGGDGKVLVIDAEAADRMGMGEVLEEYYSRKRAEAEIDHIAEMERRMGA